MTYPFNPINHHIEFTTGTFTCAYSHGQFCRFFTTRNFGQTAYCTLYTKDLKLEPETLVTLRCDECLKDFNPNQKDE